MLQSLAFVMCAGAVIPAGAFDGAGVGPVDVVGILIPRQLCFEGAREKRGDSAVLAVHEFGARIKLPWDDA